VTDYAELTDQEKERYARHVVLPTIGGAGQRKLKAARVLVVGVGGLGSPISMYLTAAGVGRLGLVDADTVSLPDLQRQVVHGTAAIGRSKAASARDRLHDLNPEVEIEVYDEEFGPNNGPRIASGYDLIVDGTDNFGTRYTISDVCLELGVPYIYGAIFRLEGQVSVLCAEPGPCYRCLFPQPPPPEIVLSGEQAGILGTVPGTIGVLQATEAIRWIVGFGEPLVGRLLIYDALKMRFETVEIVRNPDCSACGGHA
jgi:molybdopterin/thiamine biosynthesis adenylyltransferase